MYIFYTQLSFRKTCLVFPENYVSMLRSRLIWLGSSHYWIEWRMRRFIGLIHTHIHTHTHTHTYTYSLNGVNRKQKHYITTNNIWATEMSDEALTVFQKPRVTYEYRIHFFILFPLLFFFLLVFKFFFLSGFFFHHIFFFLPFFLFFLQFWKQFITDKGDSRPISAKLWLRDLGISMCHALLLFTLQPLFIDNDTVVSYIHTYKYIYIYITRTKIRSDLHFYFTLKCHASGSASIIKSSF